MNIGDIREILCKVERFKARADNAHKMTSYNDPPYLLTISSHAYNVKLPLDEFPELVNIVNGLVEYVKEVAVVREEEARKQIQGLI